MNIILSTDNKYVQHCCVTMTSVLENNSDVVFYVFTEGLSPENVQLLQTQVAQYNGALHICTVDQEAVASFPMPENAGDYISLATYYRLFATLLLPPTVKKALYMDCDIVVRGSLQALWEERIDAYALGAVYQKQTEAQIRDKERLGIPPEYGYFNAGVLLMNLEYWREHGVTERLFDFIKYQYSRIKQHDQDALNAVLYAEVKPVSYVWNFLPLFDPLANNVFPANVHYGEKLEPVVIHFVSAPKPWEVGSDHPYTYEYYNYLEKTPFAGWKPRFDFKLWWMHVGRVKLVKVICALDFLKLRKLVLRVIR